MIRSLPPIRNVALAPVGQVRTFTAPPRPTVPFGEVLKRHLLLIVGCAAIGFLAAIAFVRLMRPVYRASVSIRIDQQRHGSPVLDAFVKDMSATDVFTEQQALGSRALVESVTDSLGLRLNIAQPKRTARNVLFDEVAVAHSAPVMNYRIRRSGPETVTFEEAESNLRLGDFPDTAAVVGGGVLLKLTPAALRTLPIEFRIDGFSETVLRVSKKLQVTRPNRDANIIVLQYRGNDPSLVQAVPNAIVVNFLAMRRAAQKSVARSTVAFLRAELDTISAQLSNTEAGFGNFRSTNQVVDLTAEADARVRHLADFEASRNQLEADRAALKSVLDDIHANAANDSRLFAARIVGYPTLFKNQAAGELLHSLTDAENRRSDLLRHRTMHDSDVQSETRRINELDQQLDAIATTYLSGLTQQVAAIDTAQHKFGQTLSTIPQRQVENTQWQRRQTLLEGVVTQLQTRLHDAQIAEAVDDPSIRIIDAAILPLAPYFPRTMVVLPAAILCGLFAGLLIAWVIESKNITIQTRGQLGAISGLPVLAAVPRGKKGSWRLGRSTPPPMISFSPSRGEWDAGTEAYRSLRTNIAVLRNRGAQVILVTSPSKGDGKTRTATNLALSLARQGSRVVIVDADLRRGSVSEVFLVPALPGLSELLRGDADFDESLRTVQVREHVQLDVIGAGKLASDAAELLEQPNVSQLMALLRATYDIIVIDSPPLNLVTDAAIVSPLCDGVLLVARAGATTPGALAHAIEQLQLAGGPEILGTVLTDIDASRQIDAYGDEYWTSYAQSSAP